MHWTHNIQEELLVIIISSPRNGCCRVEQKEKEGSLCDKQAFQFGRLLIQYFLTSSSLFIGQVIIVLVGLELFKRDNIMQ